MDLRSIINTEAGDSSVSKQPAPVTPVQAHPPQAFRDQRRYPQASPGKHPSQDYGAQPGRPPYSSPSPYPGSYQAQAQARPHPPPPPPPPIQPPPQNSLRSPAGSYSAQSPYPQTPSALGQYPFPQSHQTPQSPAQHPQYPPQVQQRDSYPQVNPSPHLQHHNSFNQLSPAPHTPPIGIPGAPHPYLQQQQQQQHQQHQRSASSTTPTSAQSQQQYFNQFPQESPVSANQFPPSNLPQHQRQQSQQSQHSQPGTPLGPPLTQRQSSGGFTQPSSPYQQRQYSGSFNSFHQTPPAPPPASLPRLPSTSSAYDSQRTSMSEQQTRSQSERERSISVSPKTRPSQPPRAESTPRSEGDYNNPSKRKMEDREGVFEETRRIDAPFPKPEVNGVPRIQTLTSQQPPKKRVRYTEPPIWAKSCRDKSNNAPGNRSIPNGKHPVPAPQQQSIAPVAVKSQANGHAQTQSAPGPPRRPEPDPSHPSVLLGPWEECITGKKPYEEITKLVADWLFLNVVSRGDLGELSSRGIEIEIEAKLGQLIDKSTNQRLEMFVQSECILQSRNQVAFRSAMTEAQHKHLNKFLNERVAETHPNNKAQTKKRVPIEYLHRREVDKFYDLPSSELPKLPPVVRENLRSMHGVKVRVTYDQRTNQELARILKVRLQDLDIYSPQSPLDCRISVNFEMKWDGVLEDLVRSTTSADRHKDRLSYSQSHYQIDLTQVTQDVLVNGVTRPEREHELEIELSATTLQEQGRRAAAGKSHEYVSLVEGMIDNVRTLQRNVPPAG